MAAYIQASQYELSHTFQFIYPWRLGPTLAGETPDQVEHVRRPWNMDRRYRPLPLQPRGSLISQQRTWLDQARLTYAFRALPGHAEAFVLAPTAPFRPAMPRFESDINRLSSCAGTTRVSIEGWKHPDLPADDPISTGLTISIVTELWLPDGVTKSIRQKYFPIQIQQFCHTTGMWAQHPCYRIIRELLLFKSDRAASYVLQYIQHLGLGNYGEPEWLPRTWLPGRVPHLAPLVADYLSPAQFNSTLPADFESFDDEEQEKWRQCGSCLEQYDWASVCPMVLKVCTHPYCGKCLAYWCGISVALAGCPECRRSITGGDAALANRVTDGLDTNGNYIFDPRYDVWQNIERSFCDLDRANMPDYFTVDEDRFKTIWNYLANHASAEPREYTPADQNPVNWPDFIMRYDALKAILHRSDGLQMTKPRFKADFAIECRVLADRAIMNCPQLLNVFDPEANPVPRISANARPALGFALEILLHRLVHFELMRSCDCDVEGLHLHPHGDCRMFLRREPEWDPLEIPGSDSD